VAVTTLTGLVSAVQDFVLRPLGFRVSDQLWDPDSVPDHVEHRNAQATLERPTPKVGHDAIDWSLRVRVAVAYEVTQAGEDVLVTQEILPDLSRLVAAVAANLGDVLDPGEWDVDLLPDEDGRVVVLAVAFPVSFCENLSAT
jgi:hypothetical protein